MKLLMPGGGNEHFNDETGRTWLERAINQWPSNLWINPNPNEVLGFLSFNLYYQRNF